MWEIALMGVFIVSAWGSNYENKALSVQQSVCRLNCKGRLFIVFIINSGLTVTGVGTCDNRTVKLLRCDWTGSPVCWSAIGAISKSKWRLPNTVESQKQRMWRQWSKRPIRRNEWKITITQRKFGSLASPGIRVKTELKNVCIWVVRGNVAQ